jgi:hypothetical protein
MLYLLLKLLNSCRQLLLMLGWHTMHQMLLLFRSLHLYCCCCCRRRAAGCVCVAATWQRQTPHGPAGSCQKSQKQAAPLALALLHLPALTAAAAAAVFCWVLVLVAVAAAAAAAAGVRLSPAAGKAAHPLS